MPPENQQPPIRVRAIVPVSIKFDMNTEKAENTELEVSVALRGNASEDAKSARIFLDVELHHKDHKGPYALFISMMGEFEKVEDRPFDWTPFLEVNGPAIVFPYARELASNITARVGSPVIFPPMNVTALAKNAKLKEQAKKK